MSQYLEPASLVFGTVLLWHIFMKEHWMKHCVALAQANKRVQQVTCVRFQLSNLR